MAREGTKTAVALPHILPVRAPYQKNKEVEVLPVVDLFQESATKKKKKNVGNPTQETGDKIILSCAAGGCVTPFNPLLYPDFSYTRLSSIGSSTAVYVYQCARHEFVARTGTINTSAVRVLIVVCTAAAYRSVYTRYQV